MIFSMIVGLACLFWGYVIGVREKKQKPMYQRLPNGKIGKVYPQKPQGENPIFWRLVGIAVALLILNDLCHIFSGVGLWYHL